MEDKLLSVKEVAIMLGIKPVTVYKWLREGTLDGTFRKIGGLYRFSFLSLRKMMFGGTDNG